MTDHAAYLDLLKYFGYQPYANHANCTRYRSLPTEGTYCPAHEAKVLPAN